VTNFCDQLIAQADGKVLVSMGGNGYYNLRRFNIDGSPDAGFLIPSCSSPIFALQSDQKILIVQSNSLVRLNPDGQPDNSFFPPALTNGIWWYFVLRHNGKALVGDGSAVIQLNSDGNVDSNFNSRDLNLAHSLDTADGSLFTVAGTGGGFGSVTRWDASGTSASTFALFSEPGACVTYPTTFASGGPGQLFMFGSFSEVDGFPRPGLARLFTNPPERDFRVFTPAEFLRSSGVARVRIVRTGATTNAASVSFTTSDATAKAGVDYVAQTGTLNFAPMEVNKEIAVPLLARAGVDGRFFFNVKLSDPSPGYTNIATTPIAIRIDLQIATESVRFGGRATAVVLHGTVPGITYSLEHSVDLLNWTERVRALATNTIVLFDTAIPSGSAQFFRARKE
jgi:hypothetical protein